ncbi:MAG: nucleotide sugar dehydrogenase [Verrucomicrobiales bacterium]|nr:nucleotide sugar dehydrogenase [Verrucomicrobiales bacterium]
MSLQEKLQANEAVVAVIGMGYVGLPLALNFAASGLRTIGLDVDRSKVESLNRGESYIEHIPSERIAPLVEENTFEATTEFSALSETDAIVICVPTPLTSHRDPDLSYVISTMEKAAPFLKDGQLISLESTTYPGTTDEELQPRIEACGFQVGENYHLVFSPEREDPGNPVYKNSTIPKVIGGVSPACLEAGLALYNRVVSKVVPVSSPRVAEFTKLLENIYRSVNIGLVNEMKVVADEMNVDIWEVIDAAATKPFGFTPFYPGPGLGGHCIPIDPFYLTWKAKEFSLHTRFIELAGEINESMPKYVVRRVTERLNREKKPLNGSRVLILGLAYKSDVDDCRESPSFDLMDLLFEQGAEIDYYDPHVPEVPPTREHAAWQGKKSIAWTPENLASYDCVVISTKHKAYQLDELLANCPVIVDTRNALVDQSGAVEGQITKA